MSSYRRRQERAAQLLAAYPHAAEMLGLYRHVVAKQAPLYEWALTADGLASGFSPEAGPPSFGDISRGLPVADLASPFRTFAGELGEDLGEAAPPPLAATAVALSEAADEVLEEVLRHTLEQGSLAAAATSLGSEVAQLAFFARAFLQPLAEALAVRFPAPPAAFPAEETDGEGPSPRATCPRCGWPPQVAVLRDETEIKGRRYLVCALCSTWWIFPRTTCPACGETDPKKLPLHQNDATPHLRLEECTTCKAYLKSVDLRRDGFAVPEVEDLASVELDLWAEERGLWKISRNLLGM